MELLGCAIDCVAGVDSRSGMSDDSISELFQKVVSQAKLRHIMRELAAEGLIEVGGYRPIGAPAYRHQSCRSFTDRPFKRLGRWCYAGRGRPLLPAGG